MRSLITSTVAVCTVLLHVSMACETYTRYVWKEAWANSYNGKELYYGDFSTFQGMGKWRMEQKQNGVWVEVGTPSWNECDASSEWCWMGIPSGKLHLTQGGNTKSMKCHFDKPTGDKYDIVISPTGSGKKQKYKAPQNTIGDFVSTPGVKVTIKK